MAKLLVSGLGQAAVPGGAAQLFNRVHAAFESCGFEQTTHPGQTGIAPDPVFTEGSPVGWRAYKWKDAYEDSFPVYVRLEVFAQRCGSGTLNATNTLLVFNFKVCTALDASGAPVGEYYEVGGSTTTSAWSLSTLPIHDAAVSGEGWAFIAIGCRSAVVVNAEYSTIPGRYPASCSQGFLYIERMRSYDGSLDPTAGVSILTSQRFPTHDPLSAVTSTTRQGTMGGVLHATRGTFSAIGYSAAWVPMQYPAGTGVNAANILQYPLVFTSDLLLTPCKNFGFAETYAVNALVESDIGVGDAARYLHVPGVNFYPASTYASRPMTNTDDAKYINVYTTLWVKLDPADWGV